MLASSNGKYFRRKEKQSLVHSRASGAREKTPPKSKKTTMIITTKAETQNPWATKWTWRLTTHCYS